MASLAYLQPHMEAVYQKAVELDVPTPVVDALRETLTSPAFLSLPGLELNLGQSQCDPPLRSRLLLMETFCSSRPRWIPRLASDLYHYECTPH